MFACTISSRAKQLLLIALVALSFVACLAFAQEVGAQGAAPLDVGLEQARESGLVDTDIRIIVARIIRAALGLLGIIALLLVLYGGYMYMTAGGNEDRIAQAKRILINAGVGLIIVMSAFGIVSFVMNRLVEAINGSSSTVGLEEGLGGEDDGSGGGGFSKAFYVVSLPQDGKVCIRNINPQIVFNKEVNLATIEGNVTVATKTGTPATGAWKYGGDKNTVIFTPSGACAPSVGDDCFAANTEYTITFNNPSGVKTLGTDPEQSVNCRYKAGCGPINFESGDGVDRLPPTVTITYPGADTDISAGSVVNVQATYSDDNGVQSLTLTHDGAVMDSASFAGCKKTDTVTLEWPVGSSLVGQQSIAVRATDWAGLQGNDTQSVTIKPAHCVNGILETNLGEERLGPPECGGACGACSGGSCSASSQCASGTCVNGVCSNVMKITGFSPASGAVGTLVSISGKYFGSTPGKVFFSNKERPAVGTAADWIEATVANCGTNSTPWSGNQILVEVPPGVSNFTHIKVQTAGAAPAIDSTNNHSDLQAFSVNNVVRPRLCAVSPASGKSGTPVTLKGSQFGELTTVNDKVIFGNLNAIIVRAANNSFSWVDDRIVATIPGIEQGAVGVKVIKNNVESNSVRFFVEPGVTSDNPVITEISPSKGAEGEYITISGDNFGDKTGNVWFKEAVNSPAILGDFSFPKECNGYTWSDSKIIVKFPKGKGVIGKTYFVQINSADNKTSNISQSKVFALESGTPKPGICKISPTSGPIPYPDGQSVTLAGEYFVSSEGTPGQVFFWIPGADSPESIDGRQPVVAEDVISISANTAVVVPPENTISGPVSVFRATDQEISNPAQFSVFDCREEANECSADQHCCLNGNEAGVCKAAGEFCSGEVLTAGYVWRFATKEIPPVPHVLERCDDSVDAGEALPSPSPSIIWDQSDSEAHHNVCRNALVTVEFTTEIDPATINNTTVKVNKCSGVNDGNCSDPVAVPYTYELQSSFSDGRSNRQYLEIAPSQTWADDSWFQVVLSEGIKSPASNGNNGISLAADDACGGDSAYCFVFKSGNTDCRLRTVLVTPYKYVTNVLEAPMSKHFNGDSTPVEYRGLGLSDQRCMVMDTRSLNWQWATTNQTYARIHGIGTRQMENVDSLANTVGIGLQDDAVIVKAVVTAEVGSGQIDKEGRSPLIVDLSNPAIMEYWPNCLEVCTNAEVGVRFNVSMSTRNLISGVKLYECLDENCLATQEVSNPAEISLPDENGGTIIKIANGTSQANGLAPNKLYQVVISATSSNPLSNDSILWSRAKSADKASFAKPLNREFTWRFRTKKDACVVSRAVVNPKQYIARLVEDKTVFTVQPFSAPDSCSAAGQKLNPWEVSWDWTSTDARVASLTTFKTKGKNSNCTASCILKGSTVSSGSLTPAPVCGNDRVEPGEDCDGPNASTGCSLDCRWMGKSTTSQCGNGTVESGEACDPADEKTKLGCTDKCLHAGSSASTAARDVNASICGNGMLGAGEDCDLGITRSDSVQSAQNCSAQCLHTGTRLSTKWCLDHDRDLGGFTHSQFRIACDRAYSQCGDGVQNPDEDAGCDIGGGQAASWCNAQCLKDDAANAECTVGQEGCTTLGQNAGASLAYSVPSLCGDGVKGIGEDAYCETNLTLSRTNGFIDPWALAKAVGRGVSFGKPPRQESTISAATSQNAARGLVKGNATFLIKCGYSTDADCKAVMGGDGYGVAADSCCYARPYLKQTYPANNASNVCRNTSLKATFSGIISQATLENNFVIARGIRSGDCSASSTDVTSLLAFTTQNTSGSWYQRAWQSVKSFFLGLVGTDAMALPNDILKWCAGEDLGRASVAIDKVNTSTSHISVVLDKPLEGNTDYAIIIKKDVKDIRGVRLGKNDIYWNFETADKICEVDSVVVEPANWYFSKSGATTTLAAVARSNGPTGSIVQPVQGYMWNYAWQPQSNPSVSVAATTSSENVIEAQNVQGQVDVRATAVVTENTYTKKLGTLAYGVSRVTVALCENPWPPKDVVRNGNNLVIFPYEDVKDNNDYFDTGTKAFTGDPIPGTNPLTGDGYFNFSTFYCADAGVSGTFDDLPYLQPAVQSNPEQLKVDTGYCESTGDSCKADADCGAVYTTAQGTIYAKQSSPAVCAGTLTAQTNVQYYVDNDGAPVACTQAADCVQEDFSSWLAGNNLMKACVSLPTTRKDLKCYKNQALKRFIFTPAKGNVSNGDAIGIQIFSNPRHLKVDEWYRQDKSSGGQAFTGTLNNLSIAGYPAVSDGNNIYVDALNYSNRRLFSNIYLFSINSNAKPDTRAVFDQLIKNVSLNRNIGNNDGYCGPTIDAPAFETKCVTDLDCSNGEVCAAQVDKLKRDYRRLLDLKSIDVTLAGYAKDNGGKYPTVASGSYLPGQSLSVWDWSGLAASLGKGLPKDPVNSLGRSGTCSPNTAAFCTTDEQCGEGNKCTLHDSLTGWSTVDKRFSFACATSSLAYRYKVASTTGFVMLANLEDAKLDLDGDSQASFIRGFNFSDQTRFKGILGNDDSGICDVPSEISSISQGTCGDGVVNVNKNEQCDPPNTTIYDRSNCRIDGSGTATATNCSATCRLGTVASVSCRDTAKCGNGKIDSGEVCDDGKNIDPNNANQNGKWNKCNDTCSGRVAKEPQGPGFCGDAVRQPKFEVCDRGRLTTSCSFVTVQDAPVSQCDQVQVCSGDRKCKYNGSVDSSRMCTTVADCPSSVPFFMEPNYLGTRDVSTSIPPANLAATVASGWEDRITGVVFSSASCDLRFNSSVVNCLVTLYYNSRYSKPGFAVAPSCGGTHTFSARYNITFDARTDCTGPNCQFRITNGPSISPVSTGCTDGENNVTAANLTLSLVRQSSVECAYQSSDCRMEEMNCRMVGQSHTEERCTQTPADVNEPSYGLSKEKSCAWDCQKYGPYCGDGIVQKEHGEECDGSVSCSLNGLEGKRDGKQICSSECKFADTSVAAWWTLQSASTTGRNFEEAVSGREGTCTTPNCPAVVDNGGPKNSNALSFDGFGDKITVPHHSSLMPTSTLSIEAWIKPQSYTQAYQRVVEKGGVEAMSMQGAFRGNNGDSSGYSLEFNPYTGAANRHPITLNIWNQRGISHFVNSSVDMPLNTWTHVVATYEYRGEREVLKVYINGQFDTSTLYVGPFDNPGSPFMKTNTKPVTIGSSNSGFDSFGGLVTQVKITNRVLQPEEVRDRFENAWACSVPAKTTATLAAGSCGNALVDPGEACDLGLERNGIQCNAAYGQNCQYCSADCKNTQNVRSNEYCGNGIIEANESYESDSSGVLYAKFNDTVGFTTFPDKNVAHNGYVVKSCEANSYEQYRQKGTRIAAPDCRRFVIAETGAGACARCGLDMVSGVEVQGKIVNVLEHTNYMPTSGGAASGNPALNDPLYGDIRFGESSIEVTGRGNVELQVTSSTVTNRWQLAMGQGGTGTDLERGRFDVVGGETHGSGDSLKVSPSTTYKLSSFSGSTRITDAKWSTDALCSNNVGTVYRLNFNKSNAFINNNFQIVKNPKPAQYDVILSPVMFDSTKLVKNKNGSIFPSAGANPKNFVRVVVSWVGLVDFASGLARPGMIASQSPLAPVFDLDYFTKPFSDPTGSLKAWYHGATTTQNGLAVESFTIDTSQIAGDKYAFYVQSLGTGRYMKDLVNGSSQLRVDVYLPEPNETKAYKFSAPTKTYFLRDTDNTAASAAARYWHVFDIIKTASDAPAIDRIGVAQGFNSASQVTTDYKDGRVVAATSEMR